MIQGKMVTVSSLVNNYVNKHIASNNFSASNKNAKSYIDANFQAHDKVNKNDKKSKAVKEDKLIENTWKNRVKINFDKATAIPFVHFPRGLGGAPDYTFFEFLQTAKLPYYLGGPILAALFYAGVKKDNMLSGNAAKNVAKHMALGVGFYYLGAAIAKAIVNRTVKTVRGIDLNQPYAKAVPMSTNDTGVFHKDVEYHKVFESADFTRWDLLYNKEGKTPKEISQTYADIAKHYGIKEESNDIDATVKPLIKKTIIMARAWQYALTAFFVTLGIGMANQPVWEKSSKSGFKETITKGIFGKGQKMQERLNAAKVTLYDYMLKPFVKSIGEFWKGHSKASSIAGKSVIIATTVATLTSILMLTKKTSAKHHKIQNSGTNNIQEEAS